jgi:hypothetical protein
MAGSRALVFIDLSRLALACNSSMLDPANRANVAGRGTSKLSFVGRAVATCSAGTDLAG